jgi:hypothetical protein
LENKNCWKPILHDYSLEPSNGKLLKDIVLDKRIEAIIIESDYKGIYSKLILKNIWDESFDISFFNLMPENQIVAHAHKI